MKYLKKKSGSDDSHNNDSSRNKISYVLWNITKFLLPVVLAIGAYSKSSLFSRYFIYTNTFSVVRSVAMGGTSHTGFYKVYTSSFGELLAPIQILLYLNIRNDSDEPQTIEGFLLEFKQENENWTPVTVLEKRTGVIYAALGDATRLKQANQLDFSGISFEENISAGTFPPHGVLSGWLFLEFPDKYRERNMLPASYRITFFSGFGERETHQLHNVDLPQNAVQTRYVGMRPMPIKRDISNLPIMPWGDLMMRFENEGKQRR
jgi:hypothetical protein